MKGRYLVKCYHGGDSIRFSQVRKLLNLTEAEYVADEDEFRRFLRKGKTLWVWICPYNAELEGKQILRWSDSYEQAKEDYNNALMDI